MNIKKVITARLDLVKYTVIVVVLLFGAKYLMGDSARRAEAHAAKEQAIQSDAALVVALRAARMDSIATVSSEAENARLSAALDTVNALHDDIRRQAADSIAKLEERLEMLATAREESSSGLRAMLPEPLRVPFDEHEAIHAAELAAALFETGQVRRSLRAADALRVTATEANVGLNTLVVDLRKEVVTERTAKLSAIDRGDSWKISSDKFEAVSNRGLLARLWQDIETYAVAVGVGYVGAQFVGG